MAIEFDRQLREIAARSPRASEAFLIQMNPKVSAEFTGAGARMLRELEEATGKLFHFEGTDSLPLAHFEVTMEGGAAAVRERAVPSSRASVRRVVSLRRAACCGAMLAAAACGCAWL